MKNERFRDKPAGLADNKRLKTASLGAHSSGDNAKTRLPLTILDIHNCKGRFPSSSFSAAPVFLNFSSQIK